MYGKFSDMYFLNSPSPILPVYSHFLWHMQRENQDQANHAEGNTRYKWIFVFFSVDGPSRWFLQCGSFT